MEALDRGDGVLKRARTMPFFCNLTVVAETSNFFLEPFLDSGVNFFVWALSRWTIGKVRSGHLEMEG